jgi:hypothetical protein
MAAGLACRITVLLDESCNCCCYASSPPALHELGCLKHVWLRLQGTGVYPGPLTELDFWVERAGNLNSIHEQLCGEKIQKVVKVLELANSTYHPAFERLFQVGVQLLFTHRA